jgi:hypothetical protein
VLATSPSAVAVGEAAGLERVRAVEWPAARLLARAYPIACVHAIEKGGARGVLSAIPPPPPLVLHIRHSSSRSQAPSTSLLAACRFARAADVHSRARALLSPRPMKRSRFHFQMPFSFASTCALFVEGFERALLSFCPCLHSNTRFVELWLHCTALHCTRTLTLFPPPPRSSPSTPLTPPPHRLRTPRPHHRLNRRCAPRRKERRARHSAPSPREQHLRLCPTATTAARLSPCPLRSCGSEPTPSLRCTSRATEPSTST